MFACDDSIHDDHCQSLSTEFLLKDEGDIESFLGIQITHTKENDASITITMSQPDLISQISQDVGLTGDHVTQKRIPANKIL
jgi:hypothetical protein